MMGHFSRLAGGNVRASRFVKLQSDNTVIECGAGETPWGIAQPGTHHMAMGAWDDGYVGVLNGPPINIFGPGDDEAPLELGGTVVAGDYIKSGAAGVGVKADTDKDHVGAQAVRGGVSGEIIPVKPIRFDLAV